MGASERLRDVCREIMYAKWATAGQEKRRKQMAEEGTGGSSTGIVAIVAIFLLVVLGFLFVFRDKLFNRGGTQKIDVDISVPKK